MALLLESIQLNINISRIYIPQQRLPITILLNVLNELQNLHSRSAAVRFLALVCLMCHQDKGLIRRHLANCNFTFALEHDQNKNLFPLSPLLGKSLLPTIDNQVDWNWFDKLQNPSICNSSTGGQPDRTRENFLLSLFVQSPNFLYLPANLSGTKNHCIFAFSNLSGKHLSKYISRCLPQLLSS